MSSPILTTRRLGHREYSILSTVLQRWSIQAERGLSETENVTLRQRLSDCQVMCGEIASILRSAESCAELNIIVCEDARSRPQAILSAWKKERCYSILKVATCPWNIFPTAEENDLGFPVKGAGTKVARALIEKAQTELLSVELSALGSAKVFWETLGFEEDDTRASTPNSIPMILSLSRRS